MLYELTIDEAKHWLYLWLQSKTELDIVKGCAIWQYATDRDGYPTTHLSDRWGRRMVRPHRIACYVAHGLPPSPKARACHTCDQPRCIKPSHLYWGTARSNADDMIQRNRDPHPAFNLHRKLELTETICLSIYHDTRPLRTIAAEHKCSYKTIQKIRRGEKWFDPLKAPWGRPR